MICTPLFVENYASYTAAGNLIWNKENKHGGLNSMGESCGPETRGLGVRNRNSVLSVYPVCSTYSNIFFCYMSFSDIFLIGRKIWRQTWRVGVCSRLWSNANIDICTIEIKIKMGQ